MSENQTKLEAPNLQVRLNKNKVTLQSKLPIKSMSHEGTSRDVQGA